MSKGAPKKFYTDKDGNNPLLKRYCDSDVEYIRKDIVDDMLATAEDHAYFAGSENTREKSTDAFIEKASVWFANRYQVNGSYLNAYDIEDFAKYMKGE